MGLFGSDKGAKEAARATRAAVAFEKERYEKALELHKPYYEAGLRALPGYEAAPSGAEAPTLPSPEIQFTFNPEDQMYQIQQEEGERAINRSLAARGLYDSRPGLNVLADFNRKLIAGETERQYGRAEQQYGREYTSAIDRFNMQNALAQQNLGKYQNLMNMGMGSAGQMAGAGGGVTSAYGQYANALLNQPEGGLNMGGALGGAYMGNAMLPGGWGAALGGFAGLLS